MNDLRNEREAHHVLRFGGALRPSQGLRFARNLSDAFPSEGANAVTHYISNKARHRAQRFMRRLVQWLLGSKA